METNRLRQFRVLVEIGNLRRAADLLGMSHSGLSKSMRVLQEEMGAQLFLTKGRGIVISDQGNRLYENSLSVLAEIERMVGGLNAPTRNVVRLGSFEVFSAYLMGPLLKDYIPNYDIEVHELVPGRLEEALAFDKVDVGITYEPIPRKGIDYIKVTTLQMGIFALENTFKNTELSMIPFVVPVNPLEGAPSGVKGLDAWPDEKIERLIRYRVDLLATGLELVRLGMCAIFIPRFVATLHNRNAAADKQLTLLKPPKGLSSVRREVYIVKREATAESKMIRQIAKALRDICSDL
jgi:DNA-binding transcriptional LysR family regulator